MTQVQGAVKAIKEGKTFTTRNGPACNVGILVNEAWYNIPFCQPGFNKAKNGDVVTFTFTEEQNGQYTNRNIDKKSFVVTAAPQPTPGGGRGSGYNSFGPTIGMAINNAVTSNGDAPYHVLVETAKKILRVSAELEEWMKAGMPEETVSTDFDRGEPVKAPAPGDSFDDEIPFN